jgi:hypothetical protein
MAGKSATNIPVVGRECVDGPHVHVRSAESYIDVMPCVDRSVELPLRHPLDRVVLCPLLLSRVLLRRSWEDDVRRKVARWQHELAKRAVEGRLAGDADLVTEAVLREHKR